jgi:hypothetical protein
MLLDELKRAIARSEVVLVLGTGVTAATTHNDPATSWIGLIESGLHRIEGLGLKDADWGQTQRALLSTGDLFDLLGVAQQVESRLRKQGELVSWLDETIGRMRVLNPTLYKAIARIRAPIATTNYDLLAEEALGRGTRCWQEAFDVGAWFRTPEVNRPIFHMHGIYTEARSVVLGHTSYQALGTHEYAQFVQKVLAATQSFLFIGCGAGLEDPNLGQLIEWIRENAATAGRRHYRLCLERELPLLQSKMKDGDRVFPVSYGPDYDDLTKFICTQLAHPTQVIPPEIVGLGAAYEGMNAAAYPNDERWRHKDSLFGQMRDYVSKNPVDVDALLNLEQDGLTIAAMAVMIERTREEDASLIERIAISQPQVNVAYKICDYIQHYIHTHSNVPPDVRNHLHRALNVMERSYSNEARFLDFLKKTHDLLVSAPT